MVGGSGDAVFDVRQEGIITRRRAGVRFPAPRIRRFFYVNLLLVSNDLAALASRPVQMEKSALIINVISLRTDVHCLNREAEATV